MTTMDCRGTKDMDMRIGIFIITFALGSAIHALSFDVKKIPLSNAISHEPLDKMLTDYIRQDPKTQKYVRELIAAIELYNTGKIREALRAFLVLDKKEPNNAGTLLWISLCQRKLGQNKKSQITLNRASESSKNPEILALIGSEYLDREDLARTKIVGEKIRNLRPNSPLGYYLILPYYLRKGRDANLEHVMNQIEPLIQGNETLTLFYAAYMIQAKPLRKDEIDRAQIFALSLDSKANKNWIKPYVLALVALYTAILNADYVTPLEFAEKARDALKIKPELNGLRQPIIHTYYVHKKYLKVVLTCEDFQSFQQYEDGLSDFGTDSYFFCAKSLLLLKRSKEALVFIDHYHVKAQFTSSHFGQLQQDMLKTNDMESSYQLVSRPYVIKNLTSNKKIYEPLIAFSVLTNRPKEALQWSYKAEKDDYKNRVIYWGRFRAFQVLGKTFEAMKVYEQHPDILAVMPPDSTPHILTTYTQTKRWSSCIAVTTAYMEKKLDARVRREAELILNECKKHKEAK